MQLKGPQLTPICHQIWWHRGAHLGNVQQDNAISDDLPGADADDEFTNQLSWRLGRLQLTQDGQLQYFSSTSNLTLLDGLVIVNIPTSNNVQKDTQEVLENMDLNITVDKTLEHHLLALYFAWQNPSLYLIDYKVSWKTRQQNNTDSLLSSYSSPALVDAMWNSPTKWESIILMNHCRCAELSGLCTQISPWTCHLPPIIIRVFLWKSQNFVRVGI
jgi:hypothetical protein